MRANLELRSEVDNLQSGRTGGKPRHLGKGLLEDWTRKGASSQSKCWESSTEMDRMNSTPDAQSCWGLPDGTIQQAVGSVELQLEKGVRREDKELEGIHKEVLEKPKSG